MKTLRSAACTCRVKVSCTPESPTSIRSRSPPIRRCRKCARRWSIGRGRIFRKPTKSWAAIHGAWCAHQESCRNIIAPFWNCWSPEGSHRRARRFASTRWPASPFFFATHSSDAKNCPHHRRWHFGPLGSRSACECEFQGASPRGHAAGGRPLPVIFRRGDQPDHRQRQSSLALGQPSRGGLRKIDRQRGGGGRGG